MPKSSKIKSMHIYDVRYPTSASGIGSDAVHVNPDYSAAYVLLTTEDGQEGHGLTFTVGDGNQICTAALEAYRRHVVGRDLADIVHDFGAYWRSLANDSQLRWLGPEKGVIHLAMAALINALWDLWAKQEGKPLWRLLSEMEPKDLIRCLDFRYIEDALSPAEALDMLERQKAGRSARATQLMASGYPAYSTSVGWMGYSDDKIKRLCNEALAEGWTAFKLKVGGEIESDLRRASFVRQLIGPDKILMLDANQNWGVAAAIESTRRFIPLKPLWMEEPTSPDDVLGHLAIRQAISPVKVATGEHCQNRVIFKQMFQAKAIDYCQIDACRVGGVNEVLTIILMAAKFGVPVCPHAGGIGLCEYVQHLQMFDYVAVTGSMEGRWIEYVDHLHEHFVDPVRVERGRYLAPEKPGYSIEMKRESLAPFPVTKG
jgi:L-fuconate dehydratase